MDKTVLSLGFILGCGLIIFYLTELIITIKAMF